MRKNRYASKAAGNLPGQTIYQPRIACSDYRWESAALRRFFPIYRTQSRQWRWQNCRNCWNRLPGIDDDVPRKPDQNIRKWHYLKAAVLFDGRRHIAEIKVREDGNGHWFYDQHLILEKKEDSPYKPGTSASGSTSAGESSPVQIIGQSSKKVKHKNAHLPPTATLRGQTVRLSPPLAHHLRHRRSA